MVKNVVFPKWSFAIKNLIEALIWEQEQKSWLLFEDNINEK